MLIGMASACQTMDELRHRMALKYGKQSVQLRLYIDPPNDVTLTGAPGSRGTSLSAFLRSSSRAAW